jgi:hypothetical protein
MNNHHLEDLEEIGRMTLNFNMEKYVLKTESGCNRFRITFNGGFGVSGV